MRLNLTSSLLAFVLTSGSALADASAEIIAELQARGYRIVTHERTWLGRERVIAENDSHRREIVFVPGSGEVLRDMSAQFAGAGDSRTAAQNDDDMQVVGGGLGVSPPASAGGSVSAPGPGISLGDPVAVQSADVTQ